MSALNSSVVSAVITVGARLFQWGKSLIQLSQGGQGITVSLGPAIL